MSPSKLARLQLLGTAALFSTGGAAIKACDFGSWQVAAVRSAVAALAFVAMVPAARRLWNRREALVGVAYAAAMVLFVLANKRTTAANAIFLQSTAPLYVMLLGPWLLRERIRARDLVLFVVIAAGLGLCFVDTNEPTATAPDPWTGNLLAVLSGCAWALTVIGFRWLSPNSDDPRAGAGAVLAGNVIAVLFCVPFAWPLEAGTPRDWAVISYLGIFQIGLAYVLLTKAIRRVEAFEASVFLLAEPVMSPVWAWLVHGEMPGRYALIGGGLILVATVAKTAWDARRPVVAQAVKSG